MPWTAKEATSHSKKASTPAKKKRWSKIANAALKEGKGEGYAIKVANSAMDARFWQGITFRDAQFKIYKKTALDKKTKDDDDDDDQIVCPDCGGTGDGDDDGDCASCNGTGLIDPDEYDAEENPDGIDPDDHPELREDSKTIKVGDSTTLRMCDTITLDDAAKVRDLENGYITAYPRIARTGIQLYRGVECGRDDMDVVRVYRPHDQVFADKSVHSYTHLPVTNDHPSEMVNSSNWKKYSVGETGDEVLRDGGAVRVPMMLRDEETIKAFKSGKNQLSVGYDCALNWTPGVTDEGEEYDAVQHDIRANHLAVVTAARGGPTLKIGDDNKQIHHHGNGDNKMNMRTILVDNLEVQVADTSAVIIQRHMQALEKQLKDAESKVTAKEKEEEEAKAANAKKDADLLARDEAIKAKDKVLEAKDGEIAALKQQLTDAQNKSSPAAIDAASRERAAVVVKAQQLMGNGQLKTDGMSVSDIRRAVVDARIGNCKEWSDDRVIGAFDAMQVHERVSPTHTTHNSVDDAVAVFGKPGHGYQSPAQLRDKAYSDYDAEISGAWRGKAS